MRAHNEIINGVIKALESEQYNGYAHSAGILQAREAVCEYVAHQGEVQPDDILLCSGCSCALDMCVAVIASAGQNILIPRPGFSIYKTLGAAHGIDFRSYNLLPEKNWEVDINHMESLIDHNTAAIVLTNPSNPCGSVFSKKHILDLIKVAEKHCLPIIADEIYEHFVFPGVEYHSVSSLSKKVPVLSCGGLTKRFLVPGWRLGWIVIHDRNNLLKEVRKGLAALASRILGSNTIIQGALPHILKETPQEFFDDTIAMLFVGFFHLHIHFGIFIKLLLQNNAKVSYDILKSAKGLKPVMPAGAMYMMIGIDVEHFPEFPTELHFVQDLVKEQGVFCLPGECFECPNFIRIVLTVPEDLLREACLRITEFCDIHYKMDKRVIENNILNAISN